MYTWTYQGLISRMDGLIWFDLWHVWAAPEIDSDLLTWSSWFWKVCADFSKIRCPDLAIDWFPNQASDLSNFTTVSVFVVESGGWVEAVSGSTLWQSVDCCCYLCLVVPSHSMVTSAILGVQTLLSNKRGVREGKQSTHRTVTSILSFPADISFFLKASARIRSFKSVLEPCMSFPVARRFDRSIEIESIFFLAVFH